MATGRPPFAFLICGLAFTQIVGWGTTYYLPSILETGIARDLGVGRQWIFAGITVMMVIAALIGSRVGRYIDAHGAALALCVGKALIGAGLLIMALAPEGWVYWLAWVPFGIAAPLCLSIGPLAAVAQLFPERGRSGIGMLMLVGGLSNGAVFPISGALDAAYGWRMTCLIFAGVTLLVSLPIMLLLARGMRQRPVVDTSALAVPDPAVIQPLLSDMADRRMAFWLLVMGGGISGLISWGLPLQFVAMFRDADLEPGLVIWLASLQAYFAVVARIVDLVMTRRMTSTRLTSLTALLAPVGLLLLVPVFADSVLAGSKLVLVALAMALYGFATGMLALARATVPLELFGAGGYASTLGKLSLWLNLMFAAAPLLFAALHDGLGALSSLWIGIAGVLAAALAYWRLDRLTAKALPSRANLL